MRIDIKENNYCSVDCVFYFKLNWLRKSRASAVKAQLKSDRALVLSFSVVNWFFYFRISVPILCFLRLVSIENNNQLLFCCSPNCYLSAIQLKLQEKLFTKNGKTNDRTVDSEATIPANEWTTLSLKWMTEWMDSEKK